MQKATLSSIHTVENIHLFGIRLILNINIDKLNPNTKVVGSTMALRANARHLLEGLTPRILKIFHPDGSVDVPRKFGSAFALHYLENY